MNDRQNLTGLRNVLVGFIFLGFILTGCTKSIFYSPDSVAGELEKALERGYDGIIVAVNEAGNTTLYSAGWNNRENQTPADPSSLFKIASISKLYMAAAASKLVVNGSLSLDETLDKMIPEIADRIEYSDEITLKMMIQHRSGIPEYIFHPDFIGRDPDEEYLATMELIFDQPADFKPDKKRQYSNSNYLLLGEILNRTLGYSHHEYIRREILIPIGCENTYSLQIEVDTNDLMSGYLVGYEPDVKSWRNTRPGGSMIANAEDVGVFLRALIDGTILTAEEQAVYSSVYEYEHTGWVPGYTSIARYHEDIDAVVVQFVNTSDNSMFWIGLEKVYNRIVKAVDKENSN